MEIFDPRGLATPVYEALTDLRNTTTDQAKLKEQKNQALELYTYLSTWGMMRLKAEEFALTTQEGKKQIVKKYFACLQEIVGDSVKGLDQPDGLKVLTKSDTDQYLGLTGLGIALAQEFSFWAMAIYHDVKGE